MPDLTPTKKACDAFRADPAVQALEARGLGFDVYARGDTLTLENIQVKEPARGQGLASQGLKRLLEIADAHRVTVDLEVGSDDAGIGLVDWYTRHGFVWKEGFMAREPQVAPPTADDNFKVWFGASQVVDDAGEPLRVYHGGKSPFITEFKNKHGVHYFTPNKAHALLFAQEHGHRGVIEAFVSLQNPLITDDPAASHRLTKADRQKLIDQGHDGVIFKDKQFAEVVAFHPGQIKSAVLNAGAYDRENPSIVDAPTRAHRAKVALGLVASTPSHEKGPRP